MSARTSFYYLLGLFLVALPKARAASNLGFGQSVSRDYGSRSIFANPAALGFQTELNGSYFAATKLYALENHNGDHWETSLSYGYGALGLERIAGPGRPVRYNFGLGFPFFHHALFLGAVYRIQRSDDGTTDDLDSIDIGAQLRPHRAISLGLAIDNANHPKNGFGTLPRLLRAGATLRLRDRWEWSNDIFVAEANSGIPAAFQTFVKFEILEGFKIQAGYHSQNMFQAGLTVQWGFGGIISAAEFPPGRERGYVGIQATSLAARSPINSEVARITIDGDLGESEVRGGILGKDRPSLVQMLLKLEKIRNNSTITEVTVTIEDFSLGYAAAEELFDAIWRLRDSGKSVTAYLNDTDLREYLIASAANKIVMEPTAEIQFGGLKAQRYFIKGTLDKLGVEGQFLARGEYKSAPEMFTRTESSEASKEQTLTQLKHAEELLKAHVAKGRPAISVKWSELLKRALLSAQEAKQAGLVDEVGHPTRISAFQRMVNSNRDRINALSDELSLPDRIAVIVAQGDIMRKGVRALSLVGNDQLTPAKMQNQIDAAVADKRTKAIVLRINSPGGEVVASDQIAILVERAKEQKPVIVSMGDVAASGGYYMAAPATYILANPMTITGSIGVFLGKFNLGNLYKKIDLHKETLSLAPFPNLLTEDRPWTPEEREILVRRLNGYYEGFTAYVAKQRSIPLKDVESAAKGHVWLGTEAKNRQLVNELGGYHQAIQIARQQARLDETHTEVYLLREPRGLFELLGDNEPLLEGNALLSGLTRELRWLPSLTENPFLYVSPVEAIQ